MCSLVANDAIKLNGFTFKHPPKPSNVVWEPQLVRHRLSDGSMAVYNKGFILKGTLEWSNDGWIDADELSNITIMYNQLTATCVFFPRPDTYSTRSFNVQITNDFNFVPHGGQLNSGKRQLYEGSISFESSIGEITATASDVF
jgi:hypothetical protein